MAHGNSAEKFLAGLHDFEPGINADHAHLRKMKKNGRRRAFERRDWPARMSIIANEKREFISSPKVIISNTLFVFNRLPKSGGVTFEETRSHEVRPFARSMSGPAKSADRNAIFAN
jgi:hypothetical protein